MDCSSSRAWRGVAPGGLPLPSSNGPVLRQGRTIAGADVLLHRHRHPEIGAEERRAEKPRSATPMIINAADLTRGVLLPQDIIAAVKSPGPEVVAENDHRMCIRDSVFVRDEEPPRRRPCADDVEVVSRDERGKNTLRRVGVAEAHDVRPELHRGSPVNIVLCSRILAKSG